MVLYIRLQYEASRGGLDYHTAKATAAELVRQMGVSQASPTDKRLNRDSLKARLAQLALTSETGTASVIEVIEPDSSEEEEYKKEFSWSPPQGDSSSRGEAASRLEDRRPVSVLQMDRIADRTRDLSMREDQVEYRQPPSRPESEDTASSSRLSEPDLLSGMVVAGGEPENVEDEIFCDYEPSTEVDRPDSVLSRKKGFLKKLSIAKWAGKRKSKNGESKELESEYLKETYGIQDTKPTMRKSLDDLDRREDSPRRGGTAGSVTRISVLPDDVGSANKPGSRKSLYSGYIRQQDFKSDDSGIIATSRPDSSTSNLPTRKSYSGSSSDGGSRGSPAGSNRSGDGGEAGGTGGGGGVTGEERSITSISEVGNQTTIVISTSTAAGAETNNNQPPSKPPTNR